MFRRPAGGSTLHAGNFQLPFDDGEFGDASTGLMPAGASFLALTEYRAGRGPRTRNRPVRRPAGRRVRSIRRRSGRAGLAHPRPGQAGTQHFFTTAGRPFCLYVVVSGPRTERRRQLATLSAVLRSLQIQPV